MRNALPGSVRLWSKFPTSIGKFPAMSCSMRPPSSYWSTTQIRYSKKLASTSKSFQRRWIYSRLQVLISTASECAFRVTCVAPSLKNQRPPNSHNTREIRNAVSSSVATAWSWRPRTVRHLCATSTAVGATRPLRISATS